MTRYLVLVYPLLTQLGPPKNVPNKIGLNQAMCITRLCDLYENDKFKTEDDIAIMNNKTIMKASYNSLRLILKDLVNQ